MTQIVQRPSHWVAVLFGLPSVPVPSPDKWGGFQVRKGIRCVKSPVSLYYDSTKSANARSPLRPLNGQRVLRISGLNSRTHDRREGLKLKVCTVNVGTMKGRSHEVSRMLARRNADICCVQEVRYKRNSTTTLGEGSVKYKFSYKNWLKMSLRLRE